MRRMRGSRHGEAGHDGEVTGAGAVAVLEAVRGGEVRAPEPPPGGARVHESHEAALAPREMHGQGDRSVVAGDDQHPVEERLEAHPPAAREQSHPGARVVQRGWRDPDGVVRPAALDSEQRGHDLRQARHRKHDHRSPPPEHVARVHVEHQPRPWRSPESHVEGVNPSERHLRDRLGLDQRRRLAWLGRGERHRWRADRERRARRATGRALMAERQPRRHNDGDGRGDDRDDRDQPWKP